MTKTLLLLKKLDGARKQALLYIGLKPYQVIDLVQAQKVAAFGSRFFRRILYREWKTGRTSVVSVILDDTTRPQMPPWWEIFNAIGMTEAEARRGLVNEGNRLLFVLPATELGYITLRAYDLPFNRIQAFRCGLRLQRLFRRHHFRRTRVSVSPERINGVARIVTRIKIC